MTSTEDSARIEDARRTSFIRVPLIWPLHVGGKRITSIGLRPPTLADLEALAEAEAISAADVIVAATDLPPHVIRRLRWPDVAGLLEAARPLFPPGFFERFEADEDSVPHTPSSPALAPDPAPVTPPTAAVSWTDPDDETLPAAAAVDMADFVTSIRF